MKKTDVYVVVDTPKKAKKLKKVLDMFKIEWHINQFDNNTFYFEDDSLYSSSGSFKRTKVSIKELRNILAREYLKEGDVALFEDKGYKVLGRYKKYSDVFKDFVCDKIEGNSNTTTGFHNFIRYATEEEKALLEPKKELEVGKWYKSKLDKNLLVYIVDKENRFGISIFKTWFDTMECFGNLENDGYIEATPQEVQQALIEEAKRRYKVGDKLSKVDDDYSKGDRIFSLNLSHQSGLCDLWIDNDGDRGHSSCIFKNGNWATMIEKDNFTDSDIAIVERLHDSLLDNHGYSLESKLLTDAIMLANKIKSNIK